MSPLTVVIPVAGYGTRMYPLTRGVKKEFLPIVDVDGFPRPLVHLLVKEALDSGADHVCIVISPGQRGLFEDYFHGDFEDDPGAARFPEIAQEIQRLGSRVSFAEQTNQWGYGHAIWSAKKAVEDDSFLVLLGDHAFSSNTRSRCVQQVLDASGAVPGSLSAVNRTDESALPYFGTIRGHPIPGLSKIYEAEEIVEKPSADYAGVHLRTPGDPEKPYLCWFGIHLLSPTVMDCLDYLIARRKDGSEVGLTEAQEMARRREGYWIFEVDGVRFDLGEPEGYRYGVANWPGATVP